MDSEMCDSLIKWFQVLKLKPPHSNAQELSDGVAMAQALNQIASDVFTDSWLSKIKFEVGSNWRLKVSNLKKVVESVIDYYTDVLVLTLADFPKPDVLKIAEKHDVIELGRLLQLILGCAINCVQKQDYITQIMELEESLQQNIMKALQELETIWQGASPSRASLSLPPAVDAKNVQDERDLLAQRCHEAERQLALLMDEKFTLQHENGKLNQELEKYQNTSVLGDDGASLGPVQPGSARYTELRRQLDSLKDELLQAETQRDDFKIKSMQQEKEISGLQTKVEELHQTTAELAVLKDEIDALREASDKLKTCEAQLTTYKKKLEDHNDLKRQVKMLEERSADYLQQNFQQEENIKKHLTLKNQVELLKKEIEELHAKLDVEMMKSVKAEFELSNFDAKFNALQREKDILMDERDQLRDTCDELRCNQISSGDSTNTMSRELLPPTFKDKLEHLEAENKALREGQDGDTVLSQFMDDSNQRMEKLREQLKVANQKILSLTHQNQQQQEDIIQKSNVTVNAAAVTTSNNADLVTQLKQSIEINEQKSSQLDETQTQLIQCQAKINQLETALTAADVRYRKSVEKAKEIIKCCDPKALLSDSALTEKLSTADLEIEPRPAANSHEERLMASAFYRLTSACHRDAVDARLALLNGTGQSFLTRQRQPAARKSVNMTSYKSK